MVKKSQIIFMDGKEEALNRLFTGDDCPFGYLAVGYVGEENGFDDPAAYTEATPNGFVELEDTNGYKRIQLKPHSEASEKDPTTGKVLVKFTATLDTDNIKQNQSINQIAVVDSKDVKAAETKYYSATTFPTFVKNQDSSITFVIGFRL